jgi:hypothetical protein
VYLTLLSYCNSVAEIILKTVKYLLEKNSTLFFKNIFLSPYITLPHFNTTMREKSYFHHRKNCIKSDFYINLTGEHLSLNRRYFVANFLTVFFHSEYCTFVQYMRCGCGKLDADWRTTKLSIIFQIFATRTVQYVSVLR